MAKWVSLSRPGNGWYMCCICFEYRVPWELHQMPDGSRTDVCAIPFGPCAEQAGLLKESE